MANEIKKNDTTREKLIILLAKYIKECSKKLNETTSSVEVSISHDNWHYGFSKNSKFSHSDIVLPLQITLTTITK